MTSSLILHNGPLRCELLPALGGCIVGLWRNGVPVLRFQAAHTLQSARQSASYPLVPYSNRIGNGELQWDGIRYALPRNNPPEPHALHGTGFEHAWQLQSTTGQQATLTYRHQADAAWPFDFDAIQTFDVQPEALLLSLQITNRSSRAAPAGLGWHPFFVKRPDSRIRFGAQARWGMDDNKLPTASRPDAGLDTGCADLDVDHCFDGWDGTVLLQDSVHTVRVQSGLTRLVVFTNPARDNIAIEPVSHVNNALGMAALAAEPQAAAQALGMQVLQPGQSFSSTMHIQVQDPE